MVHKVNIIYNYIGSHHWWSRDCGYDRKKSEENADSSNDAAGNKEVNGNPVGLSQQYPSQEEMKPFLKGNTQFVQNTTFGLWEKMIAHSKKYLHKCNYLCYATLLICLHRGVVWFWRVTGK